jgi:hypothetical protein
VGTDQPSPPPPATLYALANLEIPQWGQFYGHDPRTGDEVWDALTGDDGRQVFVTYRRGDVVDPTHLRQSDLDALMAGGSIGTAPPAPDPIPGQDVPIPAGAVAVTSGDGAATESTVTTGTPPPPPPAAA